MGFGIRAIRAPRTLLRLENSPAPREGSRCGGTHRRSPGPPSGRVVFGEGLFAIARRGEDPRNRYLDRVCPSSTPELFQFHPGLGESTLLHEDVRDLVKDVGLSRSRQRFLYDSSAPSRFPSRSRDTRRGSGCRPAIRLGLRRYRFRAGCTCLCGKKKEGQGPRGDEGFASVPPGKYQPFVLYTLYPANREEDPMSEAAALSNCPIRESSPRCCPRWGARELFFEKPGPSRSLWRMAGSNGSFRGPTRESAFASSSAEKRITPIRTTGRPNPFSPFRTTSPATRKGRRRRRASRVGTVGPRPTVVACRRRPGGSARKSRSSGRSTGSRGNSPGRCGRSGDLVGVASTHRGCRPPRRLHAREQTYCVLAVQAVAGDGGGLTMGTNRRAGPGGSSSSTGGFRSCWPARPPGGRCGRSTRRSSRRADAGRPLLRGGRDDGSRGGRARPGGGPRPAGGCRSTRRNWGSGSGAPGVDRDDATLPGKRGSYGIDDEGIPGSGPCWSTAGS